MRSLTSLQPVINEGVQNMQRVVPQQAPQALLCVHCGVQLVADGNDRAALDDLQYRAERHIRRLHS